ncbi:MAG: IS1634 family transposase [Caldisericaceae bacterium]
MSSKEFGMAYLASAVWKELHLDKLIKSLLKKKKFTLPVEKAIRAMVLDRIIFPLSKKGAYEWMEKELFFEGAKELSLHHFYRAMDFCEDYQEEMQEAIASSLSGLFNRRPFVVFYDTSTTYFEIDKEDSLRKRGYSKDKRFDKPQIVLGIAINKDGYPIKYWVFPDNSSDKEKVEYVIDEIRKMKDKNIKDDDNLTPLLWISDSGMMKNRALEFLESKGEQYIIAQPVRSKIGDVLILNKEHDKEEGKNRNLLDITLWNGKHVLTEEKIINNRRYLICEDLEQKDVDRETREEILQYIKTVLKETKNRIDSKKILSLYTHRTYGGYLKKDGETHEIVIDEEHVKKEEKRDGKYILLTNNLTEDAALIVSGYRSLYTIERTFKTMKNILKVRPIYHHIEERIKAHVFLCVLAYLIVHYIEMKAQMTFSYVKNTIEKLHAVEYKTKDGVTICQRTQITNKQREIFNKLNIPDPPIYLSMSNNDKQ